MPLFLRIGPQLLGARRLVKQRSYSELIVSTMKIERSRSKPSKLTDQIEIVRDRPGSSPDDSLPPAHDAENPLHALTELVERLEALEALSLRALAADAIQSDSTDEEAQTRQTYMSQVDHYLTLFQKQSAVLRRLSNKLN